MFRSETIWRGEPAERPTCLAGDIDGDGDDEFVIATRRPEREIHWFDRAPGGAWLRHVIDEDAPPMGVGGALADLTGNGRLDLVAGTDDRSNFVYWWEQPDDPAQPWTRRLAFELPANRTHDAVVADVDGDGVPELYIWNQGSGTLLHALIPDDPRVSPWPDVSAVAEGVSSQAIAVGDVDGDGRPELVAGLSWYKHVGGAWRGHPFTHEFQAPRLAVADFDGDGRAEIALCESDGSGRGDTYGRFAIFKPRGAVDDLWTPTVLCETLLDPHTLQVADFDGDGRPDIYVGDMGLGDWKAPHQPLQRLFLNRLPRPRAGATGRSPLSGGGWLERTFGQGIGTHEAQVARIGGKTGIIGKPYRALPDRPRAAGADSLTYWYPGGEEEPAA